MIPGRPNSALSKAALALTIALAFACVTLDFLDIGYGRRFPETLAHYLCPPPPITAIARPVMSAEILSALATRCADQPREPIFSIIFFMIKFSMAVVGILVMWLIVAFSPAHFFSGPDSYAERIKKNGVWKEVKTLVLGVFFVVSMVAGFLWHLSTFYSPEQFGTSVLQKLLAEDLASLFILMMGWGTSASLFALLLFVFRRRKSKSDRSVCR